MLKRFSVRGTYTMFINAADIDEAREIAILNEEKVSGISFDDDYAGRAWIDLSEPQSVEFFRDLMDGE
jgi:hypothetical protein